jgi:hypothetical protein
MTTIDHTRLPEPSTITCRPIRLAAQAVLNAEVEAKARRRDLEVHDQEAVQLAKRKDAQLSAEAIRQGRPEPKTRANTAVAEKQRAELEHRVLVAVELVEACRGDLIAACEEHGEQYAEEVEAVNNEKDSRWQASVEELIAAYGERAAARSVARAIGLDCPPVDALVFDKRAINGLAFQADQRGKKGIIATVDALAALAASGQPAQPEPEQPRERVKPTRVPSEVEGEPGWQEERGRQDAFYSWLQEQREREEAEA